MKVKNDALKGLEEQYTSALQDYLAGEGEAALERAYELGRRAIAERRGILDMASVHQRALASVLLRSAQESAETVKKAAQFFAESMAPFEMTFRGFQESITRLHDLNRTLEQSEMKFRSVVQAASDAIISSDSNGNVISWNKRAQSIFGYAEEEVLGKPLTILIPEQYRDAHSSELERIAEVGSEYNVKTLESHALRKDGSEFPVEISIASWKIEERTFFTGILRDITERKKALEKIREQADLLDKARDAIVVQDLEHRIIYWNKGAQNLYGWSAEEAIGKNAIELLYKKEPLDLIEARNRVIEEGEWKGELQQVTKDGKEVLVESRWSLVRDSENKPRSILVINTDITEKKNLESQLLRVQRMESIGTLAGGIAHDLNNVLSPIMMSVHILKGKLKDEQSQKVLEILENNTKRGAALIKQVMSFARGIEGERAALQVPYVIAEIEKVMKETFPRNIDIKIDMPRDLSPISGDATQLHQVLMNLCVNARDAMQDGGTLGISAENVFVDENYVSMNIEAKTGSYVVIAVSDTGAGIPSEIRDRIFEPFFTTKKFGKGTGLGLSTALGIVKSHGGFINVYSEVGKGSAFKVYLPAVKTVGTQKVQEQRYELPAGKGELVFVVDDEPKILEITRTTLESYGYTVLTANDGAEAIELYAKNVKEVSVVLMDMMMPSMDGAASAHVLRKINPEVRIIGTSGLIENSKPVSDNMNAFLAKPYTVEKLLKTIHEVLSAKF